MPARTPTRAFAGAGADCLQTCLPALDQGVVGAYASLAAAPDGTVWVAAYSDAVITGATRVPYGDLVVGQYVAATGAVAWQTVDGVPAPATGICPDHDPDGWRGGATDAGDDVGLFTSVAIDPSGQPMVAYFDATHGALKLARFDRTDGAGWAAHTVLAQSGLAVGRYAQLVIVGGVPVITYQASSVGGGVSYVETIRATTATPASAMDWESPVIVDSEPGSPTTTVASDIPVADGDYLSVATTPSGSYAFVYYDAVEKALFEADMPASGGWAYSPLAGGAQGGDSGQDANLIVDASGDWHVVYVNADLGTLEYRELVGGATLTAPSVVDDGAGIGGQAFADGVHLVGAGAHLTVDASGVPRVYYGDATAGTLRVATGARSGTGTSAVYKWTLAQVTQTGRFAGLFPWPLPDGSKVGNAYRSVDAAGETHGDFVFVDPP